MTTTKFSELPDAGGLDGSERVALSRLSASVTLTRTDISAAASDNSINTVAGDFDAIGITVGASINVAGFTGTPGNNADSARVESVTANKIVVSGVTLVDDAAGESVTVTQWESVSASAQDVADLGGAGGTELVGLTFTSDTGSTADSDPGAGLFKWNHATQGSASQLFFDNSTADAVSIAAFLATLGTNAKLRIQQGDDETRWQEWEIDSGTADSGYYDFAVTLLAKSASDIQDDKLCYCDFKNGAGSGGSTQGLHDVCIPAGAWYADTTAPAAWSVANGATDQPDGAYWSFDHLTEQAIWTVIEMPKSWNEGTITFHGKWAHPSTTVNFGVVMSVRAVAFGDGDALAANYGTAQTSTDTGGATDTLYSSPESAAITVAGSPAARDLVFIELRRKVSDGSDTLAVAMRLHSVTISMTTDADNDA
jgi:hypothetical protein